jgi:hypothetical protein
MWIFNYKKREMTPRHMSAFSPGFLFILGQASRQTYADWIGGDSYTSLVLETEHSAASKGYFSGRDAAHFKRIYQEHQCVGVVKATTPAGLINDENDQEVKSHIGYPSMTMRQPETVYAHHIFAMFLVHLATQPQIVTTDDGSQNVTNEHNGHLISSPEIWWKIIAIFVEAGLGTEAEAKVCLIPSMAFNHIPIPHIESVNSTDPR